jgi:hypothetical protein
MEFLYTGAVQGVTVGRVDIDKLQAALLAAELFHVDILAHDAHDWAAICGVEIHTELVSGLGSVLKVQDL